MNSLISASGVQKSFGRGSQRVNVLNGVDINVAPAEFVAIVGKSGSGKSTLLYCLCGLLKADKGTISLVGNDITSARGPQLAKIRRDHTSFIFQDLNLISSLTVADNVRLPARLAGLNPKNKEVNEALEMVGIPGKGNAFPNQLSGGQQQRVRRGLAAASLDARNLGILPSGIILIALTRSLIIGLPTTAKIKQRSSPIPGYVVKKSPRALESVILSPWPIAP